MNCESAAEFVSALHDGERIPRDAAEHLGECATCRDQLADYAWIAADMRRMASLEHATVHTRVWEARPAETSSSKMRWQTSGWATMRIPRIAFVAMILLILTLSGGIALVRARPNQNDNVLWLGVKLPPDGKVFHVALAANGTPGSDAFGHYGKVLGGDVLSMEVRFLARKGDRVELGVKRRYDNKRNNPPGGSGAKFAF